MNDAARRELHNEKEIDRVEKEVDDRQEIARTNISRVILQEGRPGLRGCLGGTNAEDVFLSRTLGDGESEFEQLTVNAFGTPQTTLLRHLLNQGDGLCG